MNDPLDLTSYPARYADTAYLTVVGSRSEARLMPGVRSYLSDARAVVWAPPLRADMLIAVDAERADEPVSPRLRRRTTSADPAVVWPLWTRAEVVAKLLSLPVLSWLAWPGLVIPPELAAQVALATFSHDDPGGVVVVTCGATWSPHHPARA